MDQSSHNEPDYAFGQRMFNLRSIVGLTQARLAEYLGVSRRAVVKWESGTRYPTAEHLKKYVELAVQRGAFTRGSEPDEIRVLWQASRQRVLLDEAWVASLLRQSSAELGASSTYKQSKTQNPRSKIGSAPALAPTKGRPRLDWGDAPSISTFYGRTWELDLLTRWTVEERCRVVSVLGLGGIGKSALAVSLMHQVADQFDVVIWRSLRDAPTSEALLDDCLQVVAPQIFDASDGAESSIGERRMNTLLEYMRHTRVLLVLDNIESVLEDGAGFGQMREGYEGLSRLLRLGAATEHQSCLVLTSREKPDDLVAFEGSQSPVRTLRLYRLEAEACDALLAEKEVKGSAPERESLINAYAGNPLALKIVARTVVDLFGGEPGPFLEQGGVIFGGVRELLAQQFNRLSTIEQGIMVWLAILREPVSLEDLRAVLVTPLSRAELLEAIEALHRRSLVERSNQPGDFTLQSVVLEYVTSRLIADLSREIEQGLLERIIECGLEPAQAPDYVRQTQERLIVDPLLTELHKVYKDRAAIEERLPKLLAYMRTLEVEAQGYGPANILALLRALRGHLQGLDLSGLALRSVYLQGVAMQDADLSGSLLIDTVFTEAFDAIMSVAISSNGAYWAACSVRDEVWIWEARGLSLHRTAQVDTHTIWRIAFSPAGDSLACGGAAGEITLWASASGKLMWSSGSDARTGIVHCVAFAPDGRCIAGSDDNALVQLWDSANGTPLQTLPHPAVVPAVTWSPDGRLLATGDVAGAIRLWQVGAVGEMSESAPAICIQTLTGHTHVVAGLAFAPDGRTLASASLDGTVKLWEIRDTSGGENSASEEASHPMETLSGHTDRVIRIVWSPDGRTLASAGWDNTVLLWDAEEARYRAALRGHSGAVRGLAFTPDSRSLLSGSEDGTLRVWDAANGQCIRAMQGYTASLHAIDWSPDGEHLVGGGSHGLVIIYAVEGGEAVRVLEGHHGFLHGVGWSPDGKFIASSEYDNTMRLWDVASGRCVQMLEHPDDAGNLFSHIAWSPDGQRLAAATARYGVMMWNMEAQRWSWHGQPFHTPIPGQVVWSPDGTRLAAGGGDGVVYVWDATSADGTLIHRLEGHTNTVVSIAWSQDGRMLAAGSGGPEGAELTIWGIQRGERLYTLAQHQGIVSGLAWGADPDVVVTGSTDGRLYWWNVRSGECLWVREGHDWSVAQLQTSPDGRMLASCGHDGAIMLWDLKTGEYLKTLRRDRPYERLNMTGIHGLTEAQKATLRTLGAVEDEV